MREQTYQFARPPETVCPGRFTVAIRIYFGELGQRACGSRRGIGYAVRFR